MASFGELAYFLLVDNEKHTTPCVSHFALTTRKLRIKSELNSSNPGNLARELGNLGEEVGEQRRDAVHHVATIPGQWHRLERWSSPDREGNHLQGHSDIRGQ